MSTNHIQLINLIAGEPEFLGFGQKRAEKVVEAFSEDIYDRLNSGDATKFIPTISDQLAVNLINGWHIHKAKAELVSFLDEYGIRANLASAVFERFGADSVSLIKSNPYRLLAVVDWKKVDEIGGRMDLGDTDCRLIGASEWCMYREYEQKKNTWVAPDTLTNQVANLLGTSRSSAGSAVQMAEKVGAITEYMEGYQIPGVYDFEDFSEAWIQKKVSERLNRPKSIQKEIQDFERRSGLALTSEQKSAVTNALDYGFSVYHGGAGVGKTFVLRAVAECSERLTGNRTILMAVPAKACRKMAAAANRPAITLAKCLYHYTKRDLEDSLVVVDEASMLSLSDFYHLVAKLPKSAKLLLVGDAAQIPSINAGTVLYSIINCSIVPSVELTIIQRQANKTGIPKILSQVRKGALPHLPAYQYNDGLGISLCQVGDNQAILNTVLKVFDHFEGQAQIISPLAMGATGADRLNEVIHWHVHGIRGWRISTPVIYTKNMKSEIGGIELVNGLMGTVRRIVNHDPIRENTPYLDVDFDGILVTLARWEVERYLQKSYALTVHKAQGSDWRTIIAVLTSHALLVDRSMIYTALSRCKDRCVVITSDLRAIEEAVAKDPFFIRRNDRFMVGLNNPSVYSSPVQIELFN